MNIALLQWQMSHVIDLGIVMNTGFVNYYPEVHKIQQKNLFISPGI